MGYDIPDNCAVICLGNIWGHTGGRDRYLAKVLLIASKKLEQENGIRRRLDLFSGTPQLYFAS